MDFPVTVIYRGKKYKITRRNYCYCDEYTRSAGDILPFDQMRDENGNYIGDEVARLLKNNQSINREVSLGNIDFNNNKSPLSVFLNTDRSITMRQKDGLEVTVDVGDRTVIDSNGEERFIVDFSRTVSYLKEATYCRAYQFSKQVAWHELYDNNGVIYRKGYPVCSFTCHGTHNLAELFPDAEWHYSPTLNTFRIYRDYVESGRYRLYPDYILIDGERFSYTSDDVYESARTGLRAIGMGCMQARVKIRSRDCKSVDASSKLVIRAELAIRACNIYWMKYITVYFRNDNLFVGKRKLYISNYQEVVDGIKKQIASL